MIGPLGFSRQVALALEAGHFTGISSAGIITEVEAKLRLPRVSQRYRITEGDISWARVLLTSEAELVTVPVHEIIPITGDPEDDLVLATGRLINADYLVTGDRRLLALGEYEGMQIISPRQFVEAALEASP